MGELSNQHILELLEIFESVVDPRKEQSKFEDLDEELSIRVSQGSFPIEDCVQVMRTLVEHNYKCPSGYEIPL